MSEASPAHMNFIQAQMDQDLKSSQVSKVVTRFPPEPNGFLHIGHAKSICLNFGLAEQFGGDCHLRFDDTNPEKEEQVFVEAIQADVAWLGFQWAGKVRYASDYFDTFYQWALHLIDHGKAYVCDLTAEEASQYRGWATKPGKDSPYRNRSVKENRLLFEKMRGGEFAEGACVLRAKIDMASSNMNLRDPILYRIRHESHHQTGDTWCIYPSYDFAHGQEDAIEGVTHSICTLEFQDHRPLYDWFLDNLPVPCKPVQYEFGRLHLNYTVTSKRKLRQLIEEGLVAGWDDPRMPTLSGMRRRGYRPQAIRNFCEGLAVAKTDGIVDVAQLEYEIRDDLNRSAQRAMCVLDPLKVILTHVDASQTLSLPCHPDDPDAGSRDVPFDPEIYIEKTDFSEDTTLGRKKFKRLVLGDYVRLRGGYVIQATGVQKDADGNLCAVEAVIVEGTLGKNPPPEQKPRGVIHWVSAIAARPVKLRLYERLFNEEHPEADGRNFLDAVNKDSLQTLTAWLEPSAAACQPETRFQFERTGYFVSDRYDHTDQAPVFNRVISLKETR